MPKPLNNWLGVFIKPWNLNSLKKVIVFAYSALLGMFTHVIWDSFTHAEGFFVKLIPYLSTKISFYGYTIFLFKILQHSSTIVGMFIILIYLYMKRNLNSKIVAITSGKKLLFYLIIIISTLILIFSIIHIKAQSIGSIDIGSIVVIVIDSLFLGILLSSLISRFWHKPRAIIKD
jgi:hypothetical protein